MVLRLRAFAVLLLVHAAHIAVAGANTVISETFQQEISHDPSVPSPGTFSQRYFLSNPTANMKPGSPLVRTHAVALQFGWPVFHRFLPDVSQILYIGAETETGAWAAQEGIFEPTTWALDAVRWHTFGGNPLTCNLASWWRVAVGCVLLLRLLWCCGSNRAASC